MGLETIASMAKQAFWAILKSAGPMLAASLFVGLIVSIFQAATQLQEQTLSFIPKIIAVLGAVALFAPWIMNELVNFAENIFSNLHRFVG